MLQTVPRTDLRPAGARASRTITAEPDHFGTVVAYARAFTERRLAAMLYPASRAAQFT